MRAETSQHQPHVGPRHLTDRAGRLRAEIIVKQAGLTVPQTAVSLGAKWSTHIGPELTRYSAVIGGTLLDVLKAILIDLISK